MALPQLRTFVEVYRARSFSAAARKLELTQPAVSQHVASLEAQLGKPLFARHARGVVPNPIADDLAAELGDSLDRAETALASLRARSSHLSGTVHLAAPSEFIGALAAPHLATLMRAGLQLRLHLAGKSDLYAMLLDDRADLAITASKPRDARLGAAKIMSEHLWAVASPGTVLHPAASFVAYDLELPLIRDWCATNNVPVPQVPPAATIPDLRALRALLEAGAGWSVLPDYLCAAAVAAGLLARLPDPVKAPENAVYLVWVKSSLRHPRTAFARQKLMEALGQIPADDGRKTR